MPRENWFGQDFCSAPHPTRDDVRCRRLRVNGPHEGPHRAYAVGVSEPEEWE